MTVCYLFDELQLFFVGLYAVFSTRRNLKLEVQPQPHAKAKDALMIDTTSTKNKILAIGMHLVVFLT